MLKKFRNNSNKKKSNTNTAMFDLLLKPMQKLV